jgi:autotransporter adhesin
MSLVNANTKAIDTETEDRKAGDISAQLRIEQANANIEANRQASINTNKRVADNTAAIANHETRITSLEQQTSKGFSDLKRQIDENKKDANAGIAGVAAMANIPQVTANQDFSVGAGVGVRGDEQAVAVGVSGRITGNVVTKLAVSADTQSGFTAGAGVSYGW